MEYICWSRVGAAAGEEPGAIIQRKEFERKARCGVFFWQVGNAPPDKILDLREGKDPVQVVFSRLRGKPQAKDKTPEKVSVWRKYYDGRCKKTKRLPDGVLVTSRGTGCKCSYALVCRSKEKLSWPKEKKEKGERPSFDPDLLDKRIARQQVTALFKKDECYHKKPDWMFKYQKDMEALLVLEEGGWVRLEDPKEFDSDLWNSWKKRIERIQEEPQRYQCQRWLELVREIRSD